MKLYFLNFQILMLFFSLIGCGGSQNGNFSTQGSSSQASLLIKEVGDFLQKNAFAIGVPFKQANSILQKYVPELSQLSGQALIDQINQVLKQEFNISHLFLSNGGRSDAIDEILPFPLQAVPYKGHLTSPSWTTLKGGIIGYLKIPTFMEEGYQKNIIENSYFHLRHTKLLIIDLRGNYGGRVSYLMHFLSQIMPNQAITGYDIDEDSYKKFLELGGIPYLWMDMIRFVSSSVSLFFKNMIRSTIVKNPQTHYQGKLAVLIDENSASSAEHAASTLKNEMGAIIAGTPSRGALLTSYIITLNCGARLQYPVADFLTTKGERIEGNPILPQITTFGENALEVVIRYFFP